jgi:H+/gluconate symporter-like permease
MDLLSPSRCNNCRAFICSCIKKYTNKPPDTFASKDLPDEELPGLFNSVFTTFLPVLLIAIATVLQQLVEQQNRHHEIFYRYWGSSHCHDHCGALCIV